MPRPILTTAEMRAADAAAIAAGTPGIELMENAGEAVARAAETLAPDGDILVLCGPGNNGGDGFVAARRLQAAGRAVRVFLLGERDGLTGDARVASDRWPGPVEPLDAALSADSALVVDALFGAGLSRPLGGVPAELAARRWPAVLAVDTPSGLNGDAGRPDGTVFRADATVTFAAKKPAHVLEPGRSLCGPVAVADIGLPDAVLREAGGTLYENGPDLWRSVFPEPAPDGHKHRRGHLMCLTGPAAGTGAARLAARAGLRAGAGLATLLSPPSAVLVNAIASTAVMVRSIGDAAAAAEALGAADAAVLGPAAGVTDATRSTVEAALGSPARCVLDADALSVFADAPAALFDALRPGDVLTPHIGEFRRVFGDRLDIAANKIQAARSAAAEAGAVVLLKGSDTVIAAPDGRAVVNTHASPYLATAGSGDVLAGMIGGLLAQGMPSFEAAAAAAWLHGDAALSLGPGLISEDLVEALPGRLQALLSAEA